MEKEKYLAYHKNYKTVRDAWSKHFHNDLAVHIII